MSKISDNVCDECVFNELYEQFCGELYKFLYYKYGSENNPEDLVQEAFIKLWNHCKTVPPEKARSFLYTVANHQMLNDLNKKKTVLKYEKNNYLKGYTVESPEFVLESDEYNQRLKRALEELTEEQRVTFLLNRVEGKRHQEIAEMLGISRKAVEKRIYTALNILKTKLEGL